MSVQFGRWNFDGRPIDSEYIEKVEGLLAPYGPDGHSSYSAPGIGIVYHAFHTTRESRREKQPHVSRSGAIITWDGRLDNRAELIKDLGDTLTSNSTDVEIVAGAYEEWGEDCFAKLIGDWALSIWNAQTRRLLLAKDPMGTRHLYYAFDRSEVRWSTILDPLIRLAGHGFALCEEYIAGWLGFLPASHLTPYVGIVSVPPSSFVRLTPGKQEIGKYWDFDPRKRVRYRMDVEYEEHFRAVFGEAVRRRLRSDRPVLAELSGGVDSSSIVCMADEILMRGMAETQRLDTLSFYNDSEPNWNERPYFTKVEEKRGRTGCHIDVGAQQFFKLAFESAGFEVTPGSSGEYVNEATRQFASCMASQGNRVVLSGIGGDEFMGGVPTPVPELMDLFARLRLKTLTHQLKDWALNKRKPWFYLLFEAIRGFLPCALVGIPKRMRPAAWLHPDFIQSQRRALSGYPVRVRLFGALPSFQDNLSTLDLLRRQVASSPLPSNPPYVKRYPYLDRTLLEFIYAIPREQLVRPGQRRSLMRRALVGIVPDELLSRKRKAFVARSPIVSISQNWPKLAEMADGMASVSLGIIDSKAFREVLQNAHAGQQVSIIGLMRTMILANWLRGARVQRSSSGGTFIDAPALRGTRQTESADVPSLTQRNVQLASEPCK